MKQFFVDIKVNVSYALLLLCLFFAPAAQATGATVANTSLSNLEQLEPLVNDGPESLAAVAKISREEALAALEKQRAGAKYFGSLTYGHSTEPIVDTGEAKMSYNKLSLAGGLSFPLLGTLEKENIRKLETETAALEARHQANMLRLNNLAVLRKAYATVWIEQQKTEVAKRFLNTESGTIHILEERQSQGLVLPVDRMEFLAVYYDVRRDLAASDMRLTGALKTIELITGREWQMTDVLQAPSLPSMDGKKIDLATYPEVIFQNKLVTQYEELLQEKKQTDRDANLTIGVMGSRDFPGTTGNGAYIALSMTEPVNGSVKDKIKLAATEDLKRAQQEEKYILRKLAGQVEEALKTAGYAAADVNAKSSHLLVMTEAIREKTLRRMVLPGDTFEQLQHSKSQYYRAVLDLLNQEELFLHSTVDIISYVYPGGLAAEPAERFFPIGQNDTRRTKLVSPNWLDTQDIKNDIDLPLDFSSMPELRLPDIDLVPSTVETTDKIVQKQKTMPLKTGRAVYVWEAESFMQSQMQKAAINQVIDAGFSRVLISFTPKQIGDIVSGRAESELKALLAAAKSKGVRIDLLLGDPTWAEAEHRGELLTIIKEMERFEFDGIHLDIEPDSLPGAAGRRPELLAGLADTIKAVKETTTRPVSIAIHPRYLEGKLGEIARKKLLTQGLEEVVVMVYSNNPEVTARRMSAIITANPNTAFSLAQSIEKNIPAAESYAGYNQQELGKAMQTLEDILDGCGLKGIYIQAWEDYNKGEA